MSRITGDVPHGANDSGNPLKQGAVAKSALPTAVSDGQRVNMISDLYGRQRVLASPPTDLQTCTQTSSADASGADAALIVAPGAGLRAVLDNVIVSVGAAIVVTLKEETSGTILAKLNMAANTTVRLGSLGRLPTATKRLMLRTSGAGQVDVTVLWRTE